MQRSSQAAHIRQNAKPARAGKAWAAGHAGAADGAGPDVHGAAGPQARQAGLCVDAVDQRGGHGPAERDVLRDSRG